MSHFAYPNVDVLGDEGENFLGCGRYIASERLSEGYSPANYKTIQTSEAVRKLIGRFSDTDRQVCEVQDDEDEIYEGRSKDLAYLLALISCSRDVKPGMDADIWCTGAVEVLDGHLFLKQVETDGFDLKLVAFLSEDNQNRLFIVPDSNVHSENERLIQEKGASLISLEKDFPIEKISQKTVLKVKPDELYHLTSLAFQLGPNPYKGLEFFDIEDADRFFGRDDIVQEIWNKYKVLQNPSEDSSHRLITVMGASGSGKSSLMRAGFLTQLQKQETPFIIFTPGKSPLENLSKAVSDKSEKSSREIKSRLMRANESGKHDGLSRIISELPDSSLIVADQFEEIFSPECQKDERNCFIENLLYACSDEETESHVSVIIVFRPDFMGQAYEHEALYNAIKKHEVRVEAIDTENLRSVIDEPAKLSGHFFDSKIVDRLIDEMPRSDGALPLLEFALSEIWAGMEKGKQPDEILNESGGVGGALAKRAGKIYEKLDDAEKGLARHIFTELAGQSSDGKFHSRRRVFLDEIVPHSQSLENIRAVTDKFSQSEARFITLSAEERANNKITAEITHEALFSNWDSLKQWIEEKQEDLPFARRLKNRTEEWNKKGKNAGLLWWQSPELENLREFYGRNAENMTELEIEFYQASEKKREEIEEKEKRTQRFRRNAFKGLAIGSVVLAVMAIFAFFQRDVALKNEKVAIEERNNAQIQSYSLSSESFFSSGNTLESLVDAIKAVKVIKDSDMKKLEIVPAIRYKSLLALQQAVYGATEYNRLYGHRDKITSAKFSPNGKIIATASEDGIVKLWNRDGTLYKTLGAKLDTPRTVCFSHDGKYIAAAYDGNIVIKIWKTDGTLVRTLGEKKRPYSKEFTEDISIVSGELSFSDDNQLIALPVFRPDKREVLLIWSLDGTLINEIDLNEKNYHIHSVDFSSDGELIATLGTNNSGVVIKIYNKNGERIKHFNTEIPYNNYCNIDLAFCEDGKKLSLLTSDSLSLWGINGELVQQIMEFPKQDGNESEKFFGDFPGYPFDWRVKLSKKTRPSILYACMNKNGETIATAHRDKTIKIWSREGDLLKEMKSHINDVSALSLSPDGNLLISGSLDGTVKLWQINSVAHPEILRKHRLPVESVDFSPSGQFVASASRDNTICVWDNKGKLVTSFKIEAKKINSSDQPSIDVCFSPNHKTIASLSQDNRIRIWNINGSLLKVLDKHPPQQNWDEDIVPKFRSVTFSPDSKHIVSGAYQELFFWDINGSVTKTLGDTRKGASGLSVVLSPDGKICATPCGLLPSDIKVYSMSEVKPEDYEETLALFNLEDNSHKYLKGYKSQIMAIDISPNGKMIASASLNGSVKIWSRDGSLLQNIDNFNGPVFDVDFSFDSQRLLIASDDGLYIWDKAKNKIGRHLGGSEVFKGIGISFIIENQKVIITKVYNECEAMKVGIKEGDEILEMDVKPVSGMSIDEITAYIKNKKYKNIKIKIHRKNTGDIEFYLKKGEIPKTYNCASFDYDGKNIIASSQDVIEIWSCKGERIKSLKGHTDFIKNINVSPDGQIIASAGFDKTVRLWTKDGEEIKTLKGHKKAVWDVSFSPDGQFIASASEDGTIGLWNAGGDLIKFFDSRVFIDKHLRELNKKDRPSYSPELPILHSVRFSPDGQLIASADDGGKVNLWKNDGTFMRRFPNRHPSRIGIGNRKSEISPNRPFNLDFRSDGNMIAITELDDTAKVYKIDGTLIAHLKGHSAPINYLKYSPDSQMIATASDDGTIKLWKTNGSLINTLSGHNEAVLRIAFSPDGQLIASASLDSTLKFWSRDGLEIKTVYLDTPLFDLKFSNDGKLLCTAGTDRTAVIWNFDMDKLSEYGCDWIRGYLRDSPELTDDERYLCDNVKPSDYMLNECAKNFARAGLIEDAINNFQKVQNNYESNFNPAEKAGELTKSTKLFWESIKLARNEDFSNSAAKFEEAIKLDSSLNFGKRKKAKELIIQSLCNEGKRLTQAGAFQDAVEKFRLAQIWGTNAVSEPEKEVKDIQIEQLVNEAKELIHKNRIDDALSIYSEVKRLDSSPKEYSEDRSLRDLYPTNQILDALNEKGDQLFKVGKITQAISIFKKLDELNYTHNDFLYKVGMILMNYGNIDEAISAFKKQVEIKPTHENAYFLIGNIFGRQGKSDEAVAAFKKQVEVKPDHELAWFYIGSILKIQDKFEDSIIAYQNVGKGQNYLNAQTQIAAIIAEQGDLNKALEHLHSIAADGDKEELRLAKFEADLLAWQKHYDEAMAIYNRLIEENSDNADLLFSRATLTDTMGNFEQCEKDLRRILEINPKHVNALNFLGYTLAERTGRYQEAYDLFKKAVGLEPENPFVLDSYGWVLYKMGDYKKSLENIRKAYAKTDALTPEAAAEIAAHLGEVLWSNGNKDEAKGVFEKALRGFPENEKLKKAAGRFIP